MAISEIQTSLNAGELSPNLYARVDLSKFESGAALLRNFFVDFRGGVANRPGTEFICAVKNVDGAKRLIPFTVSTQASYVLEFGEAYIRFISNGVQLEASPGVPYEVTTPYAAADLALLKYTQSADVLTLVHPSYPPANLTRTSDTTFSYDVINIGPTIDPPVITDMTAPHSGPYNFGYLVTAVDLDGKEESLASNPGVKHSEGMNELTNRVIGLSWTAPSQAVSAYNIYKWGPIDAVTLNPATVWGFIGTSQTVTFTDNNIAPDFTKQPPAWGDPFSGGQFQSITVTVGGSGYDGVSGDWPVIPYVPLSITGDGTGAAGYAVIDHSAGTIIGAYLTNFGKNYTTATITANGEGGTGATFSYTLSDPAPLYPSCTAYVQQRRCFAGSNLKPETLVMSQIGLYENFDTTPVSLDTDSIVLSIAGEEVNTIKAMVPVAYGLLTFTTGGSYLINGGSPYAPITPASISVQAQSSVGANDLMPLRVNTDVLYCQNKGNRIRNLAFAWQRQAYQGSDISALAAHLFDGFSTTEWTWAEEPFKLVWAVRDDGRMLTLTYVPDQEVFAWCRHDTQGLFKSVTSVPEGSENAVYVIVERYIPALFGVGDCEGYGQYIERFASRQDCCIEDAWFLDSALALPHNTSTDSIYLSAPNGQAVLTVCANGYETLGMHYDSLVRLNTDSLTATDNAFVSWFYWINYNIPPGPAVYILWNSDPDNVDNDARATSSGSGGPLSRLLRSLNLTSGDYNAYVDAHTPDAANNNNWHPVLVSAALDGSGFIKIYVDDVDVTTDANFSGTGTFAFNGLPFSVGQLQDVSPLPYPQNGFNGDFAQFWFAPGQSLFDGSGDIPEATRRKFYTADLQPVDLGEDGSTPTGTAPAVFFELRPGDDIAQASVNRGTGGAFTSNGTHSIVASETNPPTQGISWPLPVIVGDPVVGNTLSFTLDWPRTIDSITYSWHYSGTNIQIGTSSTLVVPNSPGSSIYLIVYVTDALGYWPNLSSAEGVYCGPITV